MNEDRSEKKTRLRARDVGISTFGNVTLLSSAVVQAPLLAQSLGVDQRGVLAGAIAPLTLLIGIATLGIPEASTHFIARRTEKPSHILFRGAAVVVGLGIAASVIVAEFAEPFASGNSQLAELIKLAAIALPLALLTALLRAAAAGAGAWSLIAVERAIFGGTRLGGLVVLLLIGQLTVFSATLLMAASTFVGSLAYILLPSRLKHHKADQYHRASLVRYGSRFWIGSLTGVLLTRLDQFLMVPLSSLEQLGLYAVAVSIAEIPLVISMAVRDVIFSVESESTSAKRVCAAARITTFAVLMMAVGIAIVAIPVVPLAFGKEFSGSIGPATILLCGMVIVTGGSIGGMAVAARGYPGLRSIALACAALTNALLLIVLLPRQGAMGAALATLAGNFVYGVIAIHISSRKLGTRYRDYLGIRRTDIQTLCLVIAALTRKLNLRRRRPAVKATSE